MAKHDKGSFSKASPSPKAQQTKTRKLIFIVIIGSIAVIALVIGLGIGLTRHHDNISSDSDTSPSDSSVSSQTRNNTTFYNGWQPKAGTTWQIQLQDPVDNPDLYPNVSVIDIDLFNNTASTITALHSQTPPKKVICYFSAGSYEDWVPDRSSFIKSTDLGEPLDGWPGEWWLNTNSQNVRRIMHKRLDLAKEKGCDGVDPDNIDAYDNENGLGLTEDDAVEYVRWLAGEAHSRNLSIGLKNGGAILSQVEPLMQWSVNEQCIQYGECDTFRSFVDLGKPVFHIQYPGSAPKLSDDDRDRYCSDAGAVGFSTVLKEMQLGEWDYECPGLSLG